MKHRFKRNRQAFTLIELLVTMAIILVLVGMLIPAVNAVKEKSKKTMTFAEMKNIESAWRDYLTVYRKPPISMSI
ncbi:MAG: type II secretion system protein, partial [Kiritimatiellae bacterium]|nr:type II secretion system protein [Kiritimatiellia bacterium]